MDNYIVAGMGEVLWDILPDGKKIGGAPANFAYHVSQFGYESRVVSAVGVDSLGAEIMDDFRRKGLGCLVETVPFQTGTVQVKLDSEGVPRYDIKEDVAWDNIPFTPALESLARQTRAVCFGSLAQRSHVSHRTICRFLDTMPDGEGRLKVFDINLRQDFYSREILDESLRRCNVLKINDEELEVVSSLFGLPDGSQEERCRNMIDRYCLSVLILTCGVKGSFVFTPERTSFLGTPHVKVADTVGAGDSFTAAFVSGMLGGLDLVEAHRLAVDTSAFVCTMDGAMPVLPAALKSRVGNDRA